jgi:dTDP-4-dehydrorhamnose 3,5-epimerase
MLDLSSGSTEQGWIDGVRIRPLAPLHDVRGSLCEIHRDEWQAAPKPVQWDYIRTRRGVLRGVHVHRLRWDYFVVLEGQASIGLCDLRRGRNSFLQSMVVEASGRDACCIIVPPGVAHGLLALTATRYLYGLTAAYDGRDQAGCRFDDPKLRLAWPSAAPKVLARDAGLPSFDELIEAFEAAGGVPAGI